MGEMKTASWHTANHPLCRHDWHPRAIDDRRDAKTACRSTALYQSSGHDGHLEAIDALIDLRRACLSAVHIELRNNDRQAKDARLDPGAGRPSAVHIGVWHHARHPWAMETVIEIRIACLSGAPDPREHDGRPPQLPDVEPDAKADAGADANPGPKPTPRSPAPEQPVPHEPPSRAPVAKPDPKPARHGPPPDEPSRDQPPAPTPDGKSGKPDIEGTTDDFMKQYGKLSELSQWQIGRASEVKLKMDLATGFAQLVKGMGGDIKGLTQ